jgi:E3 ubiquitin-protein ligase MARCH6
MEWLSHSQKKYCELCKTSFRFTKLYHPGMPNQIPTTVFIRRAAIHVLKMLVTWCRGALVGSVWLVLLPYCMRVVWRSLFWVGDGGWSRELYIEPESNTQSLQTRPLDLETVRSALESAKAANKSLHLPLPNLLMPFSQTLNMTAGEPTVWTLVKRFFIGAVSADPYTSRNATTLNTTTAGVRTRNQSLLSDVAFFKWFPSHAANRFLIDVLEGQIITLLVVVAFILIFLIREWVVQQQPVMNMVALGEGGGLERAPEPVEEEEEEQDPGLGVWQNEQDQEADYGTDNVADALPPANDVKEEPGSDAVQPRPSSSSLQKQRRIIELMRDSEDMPENFRHALQEGSPEDVANVLENMPIEQSVALKERIMQFAERISEEERDRQEEPGAGPDPSAGNTGADSEASEPVGAAIPVRLPGLQAMDRPQDADVDASQPSSPLQRPSMPARDQSFLATEIRRSLEEGTTWSLANVPPTPENESQQPHDDHVPESWDDQASTTRTEDALSENDPDSGHSSESWQQVPDTIVDDIAEPEREAESSGVNGEASNSGRSLRPDEDLAVSEVQDVREEHSSASSSHTPPNADIEEQPSATTGDPEQGAQPLDQELGQVQRAEKPLGERVLDWFFGDVAPGVHAAEDDGDDEHIVQNLENEAPFVPFANHDLQEDENPLVEDADVAAAAAQAGVNLNDQDAIDDAEDLEGIMELIGMQGPLIGLLQNAMFSAVLISATLACAVWFPYLWGKVVLLFMGSPVLLLFKLPLQFIAALADFLVDTALCLAAGSVFWLAQVCRWGIKLVSLGKLSTYMDGSMTSIAGPARLVAENAMDRIGQLIVRSSMLPHPDYFRLSVNSHAALRTIQNTTLHALNQTSNVVTALYQDVATESPSRTVLQILQQTPAMLNDAVTTAYMSLTSTASWIWNSSSYKITLDLDIGRTDLSAFTSMDQWTATDRLIAILAGYAFFAVIGTLYLKRGTPISTSEQGRRIEAIIADILQQAGGVLKVILIISIEMLAFPLYCGLLLDLALLPLFRNVGIYSRWQFAHESPWTFGFVHWFIGTCYMFHFALFVSMCRKIMRKGVLYFIRDPDDPTFHPVRDVLERSVTTQLRKIAFSALVYGALVIVCLGGVVWGLQRATTNVFPIHWTTKAPSLEFPLDLLFYNFLTPFIIKMYKPSDSLHTVYKWWFKSCAQFLRLSDFLFGEKVKEEEGYHVQPTWSSWFTGERAKPDQSVQEEHANPTDSAYFVFDGKYVRAPASDQVRIPKGEKVFVEVDRFNRRKDGKSEGGVHNSDLVAMVYIPPWFRIRVAAFVFTIWAFAALTGTGITIVPLLFGRYLFSLFLPSTVEMNDIHAFSLGIYTLGTLTYSVYHLYKFTSGLSRPVPSPISTLVNVTTSAAKLGFRVLRFTYVWTTLVFVIPLLFAMLLELYVLMPLHAYLGSSEPHVVHIIQDWTLGFLYARLAARIIFADRTSRAARAFSALIAEGYMNPNARLATRCFLLPVCAFFCIAVAFPAALAWTMNHSLYATASTGTKSQVWRFSFPVHAVALVTIWVGHESAVMVNRWRMVVRDEVYLIGERLHNFKDRKTSVVTESHAITT